jgi:hypothetical protein
MLVGSLNACKETQEQELPNVPARGTMRAKGSPTGNQIEKIIGPEGGELSSEEGRLILTVPAGALKISTKISIQALSNTLPGSPGAAYRLLPHDVHFEKPVSVSFHYTDGDLKSTSAQLLFAAYQAQDGIWRFLPGTKLNEANHSLTVSTDHFSDWAIFAEFWLQGANRQLDPGKSANIILMSPFFLPSLTDKDREMEIADVRPLENPDNIRNWRLDGEGKLEVKANKTDAVYSAPSKVPQKNPVQISVEVYNFIPPQFAPRPGAAGKAIISDQIWITDDTYYIAEINGSPFVAKDKGFVFDDDFFVIQGNISDSTGITLIIHKPLSQAIGSIPYSNGQNEDGKVVGVYLPVVGKGFMTYYTSCEDGRVGSPYSVSIVKKEDINGRIYLTGTFRANMYYETGWCADGSKKVEECVITGKFRVVNI